MVLKRWILSKMYRLSLVILDSISMNNIFKFVYEKEDFLKLEKMAKFIYLTSISIEFYINKEYFIYLISQDDHFRREDMPYKFDNLIYMKKSFSILPLDKGGIT